MIIKKKLLSNEIIKKNKNFINPKDTHLFYHDFINKIGSSYIYQIRDLNVLDDGKIFTFNYDLISDYLSFNSISRYIIIKKTILYLNYIFKILFKKILNNNTYLPKNCILVHDRNSSGYFHWITDTLPKVVYAKKNHKNLTIILPSKLKINFIISSLKRLKVKYFFLKKNTNYKFKKLTYIGSLYPSGNPRKKNINDLKKAMNLKYRNYKRIYISRNKSGRRRIINEQNLIDLLKNYNFKILYSEKISFNKQLEIFSSAKFIIGLHGAGLTNLIWMKEKNNLIEIKPENDLYLNCYFNLSNLLNINYHYLICKKKNIIGSSKNSDYEIDLAALKKKLDTIVR